MSCWFLFLELCGSTYSRTGIRGSLATGSGYSPGVASVRLLLMAFWLGRLAEADILALRSKIVAGLARHAEIPAGPGHGFPVQKPVDKWRSSIADRDFHTCRGATDVRCVPSPLARPLIGDPISVWFPANYIAMFPSLK